MILRIGLFFILGIVHAAEHISSFVSDITIKSDGTLRVQEHLEVISNGEKIIHGIVREFPTKYRDQWDINHNVGFTIISITHNGNDVPFRTELVSNGEKVYIGSKHLKLQRGKHLYIITYETTRQIGFFKDHDELYWNVTGNGWRLPIGKAQAIVHLPGKISHDDIRAEGYTGFQGQKGNKYTYSIDNGKVSFSTTYWLRPFEGFTIVVSFPKGFVIEPSLSQKIWWFFQDNFLALLLCIAMIVIIILIIVGLIRVRRHNKHGVIIPLFYPPDGMTPSEVGFIHNKGFDNTLFSADIINLAVNGFVTIVYKPGMVWGGTYTLSLKDTIASLEAQKNMSPYDKALLKTLFGKENQIEMIKKNHEKLHDTLERCKKYVTKNSDHYIRSYTTFLYPILAISGVMMCLSYVAVFMLFKGIFLFLFSATFFMMSFIFSLGGRFLIYTPPGREIQDAIEGFKLYLVTAEVDRMRIVGTPPTKTPELYERYLPYAIVLDVEKAWTNQFVPIFKELELEGKKYYPGWYHGGHFSSHSFGSDLSSSFASSISSASNPSGSSSGSGGSGSSGGGGGGGGGGGW